jgi:hypothetical protein
VHLCVYVCVCLRACMGGCVCVCVRACLLACVQACVCERVVMLTCVRASMRAAELLRALSRKRSHFGNFHHKVSPPSAITRLESLTHFQKMADCINVLDLELLLHAS